MLLPAAVDDYVSAASPVRAMDAFVDHLDLASLGFKVREDASEGRSSFHPGTLLKLFLWGYLKRTRSSRGLETACTENLQAIWLTRNLRPDHSTIAQFRKDHPGPLKAILREFNLVCFELRLFGKELVAIDGTFIKAIDRYTSALAEADESGSPVRSGNAMWPNCAASSARSASARSCSKGIRTAARKVPPARSTSPIRIAASSASGASHRRQQRPGCRR